jgi:hypothetical protein
MMPKLHHRFRPKADRQLLQDLIQEAWGKWHEENFPESRQREIGMLLADRLELRYPQADMVVLQKYGLASSPETVSINVFSPDRQRWDVYTSIKLSRPVLCPSGRVQFFVGGDRRGPDQLPRDFEPFFDKVRMGRGQYNAEMRYKPQQNEQRQYPAWNEVADELKVTGPWIREKLK